MSFFQFIDILQEPKLYMSTSNSDVLTCNKCLKRHLTQYAISKKSYDKKICLDCFLELYQEYTKSDTTNTSTKVESLSQQN